MSQRGPFPNGNHLCYTMNGPSPSFHGTPASSGLDGEPSPNDADLFVLGNFHAVSTSHPGYGNAFNGDIGDLSAVQNPAVLPDGHSRFAGLQNAPLDRFIFNPEAPWTQENPRLGGQPGTLPSSFTIYRPTALSAAQSSVRSGILPSDSGYGTQPRKSIGPPSTYGGSDTTSHVAFNRQLVGLQLENGSSYAGSQAHDLDQATVSWGQDALPRPTSFQRNENLPFPCRLCDTRFRSQSELKKHDNRRHTKPHPCPKTECPRHETGFGTANDLERHMKDVHNKAGTRYRCRHGQCKVKVKDWPRADNFRNHLKKLHQVIVAAGDSLLEEYIVRNDLANAGTALEPTTPFNDHSTATSTWTASAQQTPLSQNVPARDMIDEDDMDDSEFAHPTPANECPTIAVDSQIPSPPTHGASQYDGCAADWTAEQINDHDFDDSVSSSHDVEENGEGYHAGVSPDMSTSMSPAFVRPHDLNALSPALQAPPTTLLAGASPADALEIEDDDEDDEADDEINLGQDDNSRHVNSAGQGLMERSDQDPSSTHLPLRFSPGEDAHTTLINPSLTSDIPDTGPSPDGGIKAGASPPLDQSKSSISPALDLDDLGSEAAADMVRKLMSKLDGRQLDELLRGYKLSEVPGKAKKPPPAQSQRSELTVNCTHPSCDKMFLRTSEMKKHLKRHSKPYPCTQCSRRFGSKNDWVRHENSQHSQHEVWKCDEKLRAPVDDTCNKVCHRRETFRQHLRVHHQIDDARLQEEKLDKCRVRQGEPRFWCGFCAEVVKTKQQGGEGNKERFNHIDDHYHGRNGLAKKGPGDWQRDDGEGSESDRTAVPPSATQPKTSGRSARGTESRKRTRHGADPATKRAKTTAAPSRDSFVWQCCQCRETTMSYANNPSCIDCGRERCRDCDVQRVELNEHVMPV